MILCLRNIFSGLKLHLHKNYYTINAVSFYYLWYGHYVKTTVHRQNTNERENLCIMRASLELFNFYIIKVLFLSIWMGRNNNLQIKILKHILRMHKHDFCGEKSIYTRAILANLKICMHDFFVGGHLGGGGH